LWNPRHLIKPVSASRQLARFVMGGRERVKSLPNPEGVKKGKEFFR